LAATAKFCSECGTPVAPTTQPAEYKQVTVLFADVVHSMDIAAAVGAERLREIMAELADRAAVQVQRYRGTVAQFTGDGIIGLRRSCSAGGSRDTCLHGRSGYTERGERISGHGA
jgi:class 3 adenylate cyclase